MPTQCVQRPHPGERRYAPIQAPAVPCFASVIAGTGSENAAAVAGWVLSQTEAGQDVAATVLDWPRRTTPGTDPHAFGQVVGELYAAPADWWMNDVFDVNRAVAELLRDS